MNRLVARFPQCSSSFVIRQFQREQFIPGDPTRIWEFFATPRNLDVLTPPDLRFEIVSTLPARMYQGQLIDYRISFFPGIWVRWVTEIRHVREGQYFVDEQRQGPYKLWYHEHHFDAVDGGTRMTDRVTYDVGWGPVGWLAEKAWVKRKLSAIFDYRATQVAAHFPRI